MAHYYPQTGFIYKKFDSEVNFCQCSICGDSRVDYEAILDKLDELIEECE